MISQYWLRAFEPDFRGGARNATVAMARGADKPSGGALRPFSFLRETSRVHGHTPVHVLENVLQPRNLELGQTIILDQLNIPKPQVLSM